MTQHLRSPLNYVRLLFDAVIILVGFLILVGAVTLPPVSIWLVWILAIAGVVLVSASQPLTRNVGFVALVISLYLLLRYADVISLPWLQYGLGILLILIGVVNITLIQKGDQSPQQADENDAE